MNAVELKVAMTRKRITNRELAGSLGISEQAFYNKVNGATEFKNSEIKCIACVLDLSLDAVNLIFFEGVVN